MESKWKCQWSVEKLFHYKKFTIIKASHFNKSAEHFIKQITKLLCFREYIRKRDPHFSLHKLKQLNFSNQILLHFTKYPECIEWKDINIFISKVSRNTNDDHITLI